MSETGKVPIFFILLNTINFEALLNRLDFDKVEIMGVVAEDPDFQIKTPDGRDVIIGSFADLDAFLQYSDQNIYWFIYGLQSHMQDMTRMSEALQAGGVRKEFIKSYLYLWGLQYLNNMEYALTKPIDCFATGISYAEKGLDFDCLPNWHSVNLASSSQDLYYGLQTAKYLLEHKKDSTVKFCLIGLAPYSFLYDMARSFAAGPFSFQYAILFQGFRTDYPSAKLFDRILKPEYKEIYNTFDGKEADIHYAKMRQRLRKLIPAQAFLQFRQELDEVSGKYDADILERNIKHMKAYVSLCKEHNVIPIAFVLPFAKLLRRAYPADKLQLFRSILAFFHQTMNLPCIDLFDMDLDYSHFHDLAHLNQKGATIVSTIINEQVKQILDDKKDFTRI